MRGLKTREILFRALSFKLWQVGADEEPAGNPLTQEAVVLAAFSSCSVAPRGGKESACVSHRNQIKIKQLLKVA